MDLRSKSALVLSKIYLKRNPEEAIPYLEDSVSLNDPAEHKEVLLLLGNAYIEVKRFEDAERILELILDKYPYDNNIDEVQFLISRVYLERGDIEKAIAGFEKIKELNPFSEYIGSIGSGNEKRRLFTIKSSIEGAYPLMARLLSNKVEIANVPIDVRVGAQYYNLDAPPIVETPSQQQNKNSVCPP